MERLPSSAFQSASFLATGLEQRIRRPTKAGWTMRGQRSTQKRLNSTLASFLARNVLILMGYELRRGLRMQMGRCLVFRTRCNWTHRRIPPIPPVLGEVCSSAAISPSELSSATKVGGIRRPCVGLRTMERTLFFTLISKWWKPDKLHRNTSPTPPTLFMKRRRYAERPKTRVTLLLSTAP